ncbi:MAG: hypothetical protein M4579_000918 [Chaenotheca gracillima]|nr:MAG: hypothetical protein M4579_000918 [Chaenotheca gracillima]
MPRRSARNSQRVEPVNNNGANIQEPNPGNSTTQVSRTLAERGRKGQVTEIKPPSEKLRRDVKDVKKETQVDSNQREKADSSPRVSSKSKTGALRGKTQKVQVKSEEQERANSTAIGTPPKARNKNKRKVKSEESEDEKETAGDRTEAKSDGPVKEKPKRRRKTKEEKEAEAMPLAARTTGLKMFIGAHVSSAKAQTEPDKATQAYDCFVDDLQRCEALGIKLYNFHPGAAGAHPRAEAIERIASALNRAHKATSTVKTVLENMAGGGSVIGSTFEDLRDIIALVEDKTRVGVCLDTCHAFVAGYDLRTPSAFAETLSKFSQIIGLPFLSALHLNDSKAPFLSRRDLHQNIGLGFLGLRTFWNVMNEPRFQGLPMVLETPIDREGKEDKSVWANEIKLLESLIGLDVDTPEFLTKERELAGKGSAERKKHQEAFDRKQQKALDQEAKKKLKGRKKGGSPSPSSSQASTLGSEDDEV